MNISLPQSLYFAFWQLKTYQKSKENQIKSISILHKYSLQVYKYAIAILPMKRFHIAY